MRKVLFVVLPRFYDSEEVRKKRMAAVVVPYGVLSIASYILNATSDSRTEDIRILDFNTVYCTEEIVKDKISSTVLEFKPDIVGISVIFNEAFHYIKHVCEAVKSISEDIITVVGGAVGTNLYEEVFGYTDAIDAISYSEGELAFAELVNCSSCKETLHTFQSFLTREDMQKGKIPVPTVVDNLDHLPYINFDLVDLTNYGVRSGLAADDYVGLPIHTTRGCPFNCIFCAAASVHGKKLRKMSAARVINELNNMVGKYGINHVQIDDDQFLLDMDRAKAILREIVRLCIIPEFDSGFSARYLDKEIVELLKEAKVNYVTLAIESGSERMLKEVIEKPLTNEEAKKAVGLVHDAGLYPRAFFVVGIPGETEKDRKMTLEIARELELDWAWFSIAAPFKGSRLFKQCIENGYIDDKYAHNTSDFTIKQSIINTEDFKAEYISRESYIFNLDINFVNHASIRKEDWERTVKLFRDFVQKMPSHAFAWYSLAQGYRGLNEIQNYTKAIEMYKKIVKEDLEWKDYDKVFHLSQKIETEM